jgi:putative addiction module CopG family antidote
MEMKVVLPTALGSFVNLRVEEGGFASPGEYVRELIRADKRQLAKQRIEAEILRGLASGEPRPMTKSDWDRLKSNAGKRARQR